jgi:hypothetical protein
MKARIIICGIVMLAFSMFISLTASAECPPGKSEIVIIPPSGILKTFCVPDRAIEQIENAEEHSSGNVAVEPEVCGGIAQIPCPEGYACVDDPRDDCDPNQGGADCAGICVKTL